MSDHTGRNQKTSRQLRADGRAAEKVARKKKAEAMIEMVRENLKPVPAEDAPKKKRKR